MVMFCGVSVNAWFEAGCDERAGWQVCSLEGHMGMVNEVKP